MFGFGKIRDWSEGDISPQYNKLPTLLIPGFVEFADYLIGNTGRPNNNVLRFNVLTGVFKIVNHQLTAWANMHKGKLRNEFPAMYNQIINRKGADFHTVMYALSYYGVDGIGLALAFAEFLEKTVPVVIESLILEGKYDKLD